MYTGGSRGSFLYSEDKEICYSTTVGMRDDRVLKCMRSLIYVEWPVNDK